MQIKIKQLASRWLHWWRPFWWGDPCKHGIYGHDYSGKGCVLECSTCMRDLRIRMQKKIAAERASELRSAFGASFIALENRVSRLENKPL